jgi:hypothetical protein
MSDDLPANIREFSTIAGIVFAQLYDAFPEIINVDVTAIAAAMGIDKDKWKEQTLPSGRRFNAVQSLTIGWLNSEDFIRSFGSFPGERVVLTAKGLAAMNALPSELGGQRVGVRLTEAVKQSATYDFSKIGDLIGGIFGGYTKSLGSG